MKPVVIAGAGIGGLSLALTLHQIGVPCVVYESVGELRELGVGINLQPNAVRELFELGIDSAALDNTGVQTKEWALVGRNGKDVYSEPRGIAAGSRWPQYSVHRGKLQMLLYEQVRQRLGPNVVHMGHRLVGFETRENDIKVSLRKKDGTDIDVSGSLLIGADGLHSVTRAQMYPDQPPIKWGGAIMWRGTSKAIPLRTGASFIGLGSHRQRIVMYPITPPDPTSGLSTINWIAEVTVDSSEGWGNGDWNKRVELSHFIHHFEDWNYEWLDIPGMLAGASEVFEYPMVDRDPIPSWVEGRAALLGDAAHVMYPTGSNGASQAIVDARVLGASLLQHGLSREALVSYDQQLCSEISEVVLRNRGAGPFRILNILDERCGGEFDDIEEVFPAAEREALMKNYKLAAGYAAEKLNSAPSTILPGARLYS